MKTGVLTFHRAQNYGAILQAYALQKTLINMGVKSELIDYRPKSIEDYYKTKKLFSLKNIKRLVATILYNGKVVDNRENFDDFIKKFLFISNDTYVSSSDLKKINDSYDKYIVGSDQVWNYLITDFDSNYMLDFVSDNQKKYAYAASFGLEDIPNDFQSEYQNQLSKFNSISVRENQGSTIVEKIIGYSPEVVLDPTLLLNKNDWLELSEKSNVEEDYVLLYVISETKEILDLAKKIAKKHNLKVKYVNDRLYKRKGVENLSKINVNEWVSLFLNAKFIVTNSFHGICFSINFNKDFYMNYLPKGAKVNSRLKNILELFKLEERNVVDIEDNQKINYQIVNEILDEEREKSILYIKTIIDRGIH